MFQSRVNVERAILLSSLLFPLGGLNRQITWNFIKKEPQLVVLADL